MTLPDGSKAECRNDDETIYGHGRLQDWEWKCDGKPETDDYPNWWKVGDPYKMPWIPAANFAKLPYVKPGESKREVVDPWKANSAGFDWFGNAGDVGAKKTECIKCDGSREIPPDLTYAGIQGYCCDTTAGAYAWSPLLVDIGGLGYPDLLAGPDAWAKYRPVSAKAPGMIYRLFEMRPGENTFWEWVGPQAGILVYAPKGEMPSGRITGGSLFGNFTAGEQWPDGYRALATLCDRDGDGVVAGDELSEVAVWRDANTDAVIQPGEVVPSKTLLKQLVAKSPATLFVEQGAVLLDGRVVPTWDWWPRALKHVGVPVDVTMPGQVSAGMNWAVVHNGTVPEGAPRGMLRFFIYDGLLYVVSTGPDFSLDREASVAPVRVSVGENLDGLPAYELSWEFRPLNQPSVKTKAVYSVAKDGIFAQTRGALAGQQIAYNWQAYPANPPFSPGFMGVSDEAFAWATMAATSAGSPHLLVPAGAPEKPPSGSLGTLLRQVLN